LYNDKVGLRGTAADLQTILSLRKAKTTIRSSSQPCRKREIWVSP
jgi:hypothetical protein